MDTNRRPLAILGLSTSLLLAACGGTPAVTSGGGGPGATTSGAATQAPGGGTATQAPGGGATVDACALLTAADVDAVTGSGIESATARPMFGIFQSGCEWVLIDADAMVPPTIGLGVMTTGGKDYYDTYFAPFNEEGGYEAIEGLGDEAVDSDFGSVLVVSGDAFFNLQYIGGGFGGDDTAVSTDLAKKLVANLGN